MKISKARASKCVSHHWACDCRELHFQQMEETLNKIVEWSEHYEDPPETVLNNINRIANKVLEEF
jgi:hypothetical protein